MTAQPKTQKQSPLRCLPELFWWAAVVGFAVYLGCERTVTLSYVSVNGDFQSYNVFRRLLAGQLPYRDFANYIGMAPVLLCQWLVALLGGSFKASLFATNFVTCVLFCAACRLLLRLAGAGRLLALLVSCALPKLISTQILCALPGRFWAALNERFTGLYTPANSMRMARCFLPFVLAGAVMVLVRWRGLEPLDLFRTPGRCAVCGAVLGLCMVWSSDYSLACLAAGSVIFLLLHLCRYRAGWRRFAACLACWALRRSGRAGGGGARHRRAAGGVLALNGRHRRRARLLFQRHRRDAAARLSVHLLGVLALGRAVHRFSAGADGAAGARAAAGAGTAALFPLRQHLGRHARLYPDRQRPQLP